MKNFTLESALPKIDFTKDTFTAKLHRTPSEDRNLEAFYTREEFPGYPRKQRSDNVIADMQNDRAEFAAANIDWIPRKVDPQLKWKLKPHTSWPTRPQRFMWTAYVCGYSLMLSSINPFLLFLSRIAEHCSLWHDHHERQLREWKEIEAELENMP